MADGMTYEKAYEDARITIQAPGYSCLLYTSIRFAANFVEEDCDYPEKAGVNLNIFWAFAEGFLKKTAASLTKTEVDTLAPVSYTHLAGLRRRFQRRAPTGDH